MVLQRTFEVSHLKDYLRSAEGIHKMFEQLGYDVYDPEPLDAQDIDMNTADAEYVRAVYLINGMDFGHTIWLFEVDDMTTMRLRGLAYEVLQRAGTHTLVVTKDYREVIIAHPYFVGGTGKSHTRVNKLKIDTRNPTRHDVDTINALLARDRKPQEIYKSQDDAFNVNRVTNRFYREYREYFHRVQDVVVEWNRGIAEFQNSDQRDKLHAFVQRLMGRLMFLYFLQRKGWLGGRSDFLTWQYRQMINRHAGELSDKPSYYYREVLEPLFFDTLNRKRPDNWTQWGVEIPYLNGGLFDKSRDPDGMITLPDELFDPNSNTGLLAFFNRYNFTITDDAPMEQDVAVDPEMLGKVFENMLEEEDRGQSGSFYTPRTIVSYMCQEALAGYLEESAGIPREATRRHFDPDDDITFTPEQAQGVSDALDTLTVLDPAVGSGSFLIGMLNEIITLRKKCYFALTLNPSPDRANALGEGLQNQPSPDTSGEALKGTYRQMAVDAMVYIARDLRQRETPSEDILWECLRDRRLANLKFRRQHPVAHTSYVVDFFCYESKLIIELDGKIHDQQEESDTQRQRELEGLGLRVIRFKNEDVFDNLENVLTTITQTALDSPLPVPQERSGEGQGVRADLIATWKEAIIRDTLYGVDIKPGAIEIAQLRLWLSLVVNQTLADAKPLPNLDYKLMAGNSLIETIDGEPILSESARQLLDSAAKPQQPALFDLSGAGEEARKLEDLRRAYFHATPDERKQLSADIRFQERRIIEAGLNDMRENVSQRVKGIEKKYGLAGSAWKNADAKKYAELLAKAERLNALTRDLWNDTATLPFFLYRLHFNDVFARKGGFDVVVANPPYVRQELISDQKPDLQASYLDVYAGTADLFVYFFARAFDLLRENGHLSFITPNKFMRANYGKKLRGFLAKKVRLHTLIDFGDLPIFDATTYPMITIASKSALTLNPSPDRANALGEGLDSPLPVPQERSGEGAGGEGNTSLTLNPSPERANALGEGLDSPLPVPQERSGEGAGGEGKIKILQITALSESESLHTAAERAYNLPQSTLSEEGWQLSAPEIRALMDKLKAAGKPLGEYVKGAIYYGIKTGLNEAFIIDEAKRAELIAADPKSAEIIKPYLRGRDVKRWQIDYQGLYILFIRPGTAIENYPAIKNHLEQYQDKLSQKAGNNTWYELQTTIAYHSEFNKPKLVYPDIAKRPEFSVDTNSLYINDTTFMIPLEDFFLLGVLNSSVNFYYFSSISSTVRGGFLRFKSIYVKQIPIPDAPDDLRGKIAALAQQCLDAAKDNPDTLPALEAELNQLVYQAYGLDEDDIAVIEGHLSGAGVDSSGADDLDGDEE